MKWYGVWSTFWFELEHSMRPARIGWWVGLAFFPVAIFALIYCSVERPETDEPWMTIEMFSAIAFMLVVEVQCLLGLLLTATTAIQVEVERKNWPYLSTTPAGKGSILLGKYLASVAWTAFSGWASISMVIAFAEPKGAFELWKVFLIVVFFSCLAYGAVFTLLGVVFIKRAMVIALSYALFIECIVFFIPALVNKFTVSYRLVSLFLQLFPQKVPTQLSVFFGTAPSWQHATFLLLYAATFLLLAWLALYWKELVKPEEP